MARPTRYISLEFNPYVPWNRGILKGVEAFAQERPEWHLLLHNMLPGSQMEMCGSRNVAAGVIADKTQEWAFERGIPQVCFDVNQGNSGIPKVNSDFHAIGALAAVHLIESGYRHLACFEMTSAALVDQYRDKGFREKAGALNVPVSEVDLPRAKEGAVVQVHLDKMDSILAAFRALPRPTGFFARNLVELYLAHHLIREAGLSVPNEIGLIVGGNDRDMMEALNPSVTGISRNTYGVGYKVAEQLQRLFEGKTVEPVVKVPLGGIIGRGSTQLNRISDEVVRQARKLIQERLGRPVKLSEIARATGVSESSLRRRFRAALHRSPVDEVQRLRLERARELLENEHLSVSEVSEKCGFAEPAQLSRMIKAATGLTPTQFRSQALRERAGR